MIYNLYVSLVRTILPILVGWVGALLAQWGFHIENAVISADLAGLFSIGYYTLFRALEAHAHPGWGWLLGMARPPQYDQQSGAGDG